MPLLARQWKTPASPRVALLMVREEPVGREETRVREAGGAGREEGK